MDGSEADFFELLADIDKLDAQPLPINPSEPIPPPTITISEPRGTLPEPVDQKTQKNLSEHVEPQANLYAESLYHEHTLPPSPLPDQITEQEAHHYQNQYYCQQPAPKEPFKELSNQAEPPDKPNLPANCSVFLENLPRDVTEAEIEHFCRRAGLIRLDLHTGRKKIKLYTDEHGQGKGECLVTFHHKESVDIALNFLDGELLERLAVSNNASENPPALSDRPIKISLASFSGNTDKIANHASLRSEEDDKEAKRLKKTASEATKRLLSWDDDVELPFSRIAKLNEKPLPQKWPRDAHASLILENVFTPDDLMTDPRLLPELQEDMQAELSKYGPVHKISIYDQHPKGIVKVDFKKKTMVYADFEKAIHAFHHRWFDNRRLLCHPWDGITQYEDQADSAFQAQIDKRALF